VLISLLMSAGLLLTVVGRSARRAERAKAVLVTRPPQVEKAARRVRRRSRRVLAPRITVLRVADPLWQAVVRRFAGESEVVLVDVSYPTDNLLWEVHTLESSRARWLPIGRVDRLEALAVDPAESAAELRAVLEGREVIGYRLDDPEPFSEGLRHSLNVLAAQR
jgi:hypothetical protein